MHSMVSFRVDQRSPSCWRFITRLASLWIRACRRTLCIWISQRLSTMSPTKGCFWNSPGTESAGNFCSGSRAIYVDAVSSAWSADSLQVVLQFHRESLRAVSSASAVFSLCEWSSASDTESYRTLRWWFKMFQCHWESTRLWLTPKGPGQSAWLER